MPETEALPVPTVDSQTSTESHEPTKVVVYDDPVNLMEYVVFVFQKVFGYSKERATKLMHEVHNDGRSIVWEGELEKAELHAQQLLQYQLSASIES